MPSRRGERRLRRDSAYDRGYVSSVARGRRRRTARLARSLLNKTYSFKIRAPVPAGNISILSSTYGSCFDFPSGSGNGTAPPTIIRALYNSGAPGTEASFGMYFTLQDIPQYGIYTQLFDQYKISKIKVILIPQGICGDGVYSTSTQAAQQTDKSFWCTVDLDDGSAVSRQTLIEYQTAKLIMVNQFVEKPIKIMFVPHVAIATYSGSFGSYTNMKPQWQDTASSQTQHYGFKCCWSSPISSSESTTQFAVYAEYYLKFKNVT